MNQTAQKSNSIPRPPIVVVMGHIDHGKTTLLDYIRRASVAGKESGGITQHMGAYEAEVKSLSTGTQGKKITFLDTPGHEAFSKMRSRGAGVADIAVLVVAADDGVKPQTKEALKAIEEAKIPYAVAINKIDRSNADVEKITRELAEANVFLEGKGGNVPWVPISAKDGTGVDRLMETILLMADLEELTADSQKPAEGVVIESHLDSKRGIAATLLVRDGSFEKGESILAGLSLAKVRIAEDFKGDDIKKVLPSTPVVIVGFDSLPQVGAKFKAYSSQKEAQIAQKEIQEGDREERLSATSEEKPGENVISLGVVVKADTLGSAEAVEYEIKKLEDEKVKFKFLRMMSGNLSEDDINLAASAENSIAIAFRSVATPESKESAAKLGVTIAEFQIIYEVVDYLKEYLKTLIPEEEEINLVGKAKVLKIFSQKGKSQVIGGRVEEGTLKRGYRVNVVRRENKIGEGKINNLQHNKLDTDKVEIQEEFGAMVECGVTISIGDILEVVIKK